MIELLEAPIHLLQNDDAGKGDGLSQHDFRKGTRKGEKGDEKGTAKVQEQALDMTRQLNDLFESWIRKRPQDRLCTKRRWPKEAYGDDAGLENP